jgi:hypothetical protein
MIMIFIMIGKIIKDTVLIYNNNFFIYIFEPK